MKLVKMSLAAAMLMGVSAYAVENVKISGDAKVYYTTSDATASNGTGAMGYDAVTADTDGSLFDKDSSAADAALNLKVSADLAPGMVSVGASYTVLTTLGLENNFVSNVWGGAHGATLGEGNTYAALLGGAKVDNANWFNEAWAAITLGHTTAKVGRMELDTPLAFTETWSIERNSFEGAVLLNQDLPDTTLVAAWVGNGNGTEAFGDGGSKQSPILNVAGTGINLAAGPVVNQDGDFATYGINGAYAFAIVNNSIKPLTVQAWYYDVVRLAQAYWIQADLNLEGILVGGQYANVDAGDVGAPDANSVFAVMGGFATDAFTVKAAFSSVDDGAGVGAGWNTATSTGASKLYTEAWWNYGYVSRVDTTAFNVSATAAVAGINLGAYYTSSTTKDGIPAVTTYPTSPAKDLEMNELTVTAGVTLLGALDVTLAYINTTADDQNDGDSYNMVQGYITLNF